MKSNAIIRIVLFSLAILVLLGILASVLFVRAFMIDLNESGIVDVLHNVFEVRESDEIRIDGSGRSGEYDGTQIHDIEIEWAAGTIVIQPGDTRNIYFEESAVSNSDYQLTTKRSGDKLSIKFCEEIVSSWGFGAKLNSDVSKDLVITVPRDWNCDTLEIDAAAARVEITDLQINELDFDGASGELLLDNCTIVNLDVDTASGDVEFSGVLKQLDFDAASAKFYGEFYQVPQQLYLDSMSGDVDLILPEYCGFEMDYDTLSGSFNSDFAFSSNGTSYRCGNGDCQIKVSGMSADVNIRKGVSVPQSP